MQAALFSADGVVFAAPGFQLADGLTALLTRSYSTHTFFDSARGKCLLKMHVLLDPALEYSQVLRLVCLSRRVLPRRYHLLTARASFGNTAYQRGILRGTI